MFVECGSQSGRFTIRKITFVTIKDLHFIGCGGNRVSQVEQFKVEDTIFEGVEGRGTALVLNKVTDASITRSSFFSNVHDSNILLHIEESLITSIVDTVINYASDQFESLPLTIGGALLMISSDVSIVNSKFTDNTAVTGGALFVHNSSLRVVKSGFCHNRAGDINVENSNINADDYYYLGGGVMLISDSSCTITNSIFTNSAAYFGGVMYVLQFTAGSQLSITNCTFSNNSAAIMGGVMLISGSSLNIIGSSFTNNSCIASAEGLGGGVMVTFSSSLNIFSSTFTNNSAHLEGGVMKILNGSSININNTNFTSNSAANAGGVICASHSSFNIVGSNFFDNKANRTGGIMVTIECSVHITDGIFDHNLGSLYIFNSNLTFSGYILNCKEPSKTVTIDITISTIIRGTITISTHARPEGGAITSFRSTVIFTGVSNLLNNQARRGGAILAIESKIMVYGEITVANNTATLTNSSGGGISLQQSELDIKGNTTISGNDADRGGGIHATSSTIAVYQPFTLRFINNRAKNGSGLNLESAAKLYIMKPATGSEHLLIFQNSHASYGGAIYVDDDTNSGACSSENECFIQTLALHQELRIGLTYNNILFFGNTASEQGANIFGGLLDRCIPSPFAEAYALHYTGVSYIGNISNLTSFDTISSLPVRICFCKSKSDLKPDCSYQPPTISVKKGEAFTVPLVAVDQVNHSVEANIISSLSSQDGGFDEGQQTQSVGRNCSDVIFSVFSPHNSEIINLFADGPCGNSKLSIERLQINFTECTCRVGFQPLDNDTRCECDCDSKLSRYITDCNSTTEIIVRTNTNAWITHTNDSYSPGYIIHPNCPFDYCHPPTESVSMNLNIPNGADAQCAYNRSGILCGGCQENFSLSLGSSRCLPCHSHWPAVLVVILLAAIVAGILLVTALLVLNMTVAVGLINGFIFYANIVAANSTVFFPSSEPSFPSMFVAWLNLDIGIDVCFFDGLDAYTKTWLQLAFPVYVISLVIIVVIVSEYSPRFAGLIGKRDPIATLATLILLSYAKLLSVTITALSFAVLDYPDGSRETVWLPDGNVPYFQGKHVALTFVVLFIVLIGVPYTILLFLWQWIVRAPKWKIFKWTRNTKLNAFVSVHHVPYNSRYRYWTGLLLLVRVVLYITTSVTVSADPQTSLLLTIFLVSGLFIIKEITGARMYKKSLVNVVEIGLYVNLIALSAFSWYRFKIDNKKDTAVAYTSTIITFILLFGVIIYHVHLLVRKDQPQRGEEVNEYPLAPVAKAKVTHSVVEIPKPRDQSPPPEDKCDQIEIKELTCTATPVYQ